MADKYETMYIIEVEDNLIRRKMHFHTCEHGYALDWRDFLPGYIRPEDRISETPEKD